MTAIVYHEHTERGAQNKETSKKLLYPDECEMESGISSFIFKRKRLYEMHQIDEIEMKLRIQFHIYMHWDQESSVHFKG